MAPAPPSRLARLLLTAFGLGLAPLAPGTVASVATAASLLLAESLAGAGFLAALLLLLAGSAVTLAFAGRARRPDGGPDPGWVVSDEVAGQSLAWLGGWAGGPLVVGSVLALLLFRAFDIGKPWPIRALEGLPGGWGVLADDLAAGLVAGAAALGVGLTLGTGSLP